MTFSEKLRNQLFWLTDTIKGGSVKTQLNQIKAVFDNPDTLSAYTQSALAELLSYATEQVPFYQNLKGGQIETFPVIDKNLLRADTERFCSVAVNPAERIPATTSGSTGTPFTVYHDRKKKIRNSADTIFFAKLGGYELGTKLYYFKIWSAYNKKSRLLRYMQNIEAVDALNLKANLGTVLKKLQGGKQPVAFLGYVSAFETICKYLDTHPLEMKKKVSSVITMSESLDDYTKETAAKHFGCPVLSRYSNIENGIIAQQTIDSPDDFVINMASYYVEILDMNDDKVLEHGQLGRIVVTDYYSLAMPLIRYDTGDMGVLEEKLIGGRKLLVLSRIEGRKLDRIYNTKGELISSYIVYKNMWKYTEIEQYQFIQQSAKQYLFKVCIREKFKREDELIGEFKSYLGADADFQVEYVEEIPLLNSGKRKKVMNISV